MGYVIRDFISVYNAWRRGMLEHKTNDLIKHFPVVIKTQNAIFVPVYKNVVRDAKSFFLRGAINGIKRNYVNPYRKAFLQLTKSGCNLTES